jgi:outer membrane lipoprotein carrier protein
MKTKHFKPKNVTLPQLTKIRKSMKYLLIFTLFFTSLFAFGESIQSFEADFTQTVTDEENKVLKYKGTMHSKRPSLVLWNYTSPINKKIYVDKKRAVIVEAELEQAIIKHLRGEIDFFEILAKAKATDKSHYIAYYKDLEFTIEEENGVIISLAYTDQLENKVLISFTNQKQNRPIEDTFFIPKIPKDFDIIRE